MNKEKAKEEMEIAAKNNGYKVLGSKHFGDEHFFYLKKIKEQWSPKEGKQ